MSWGFLALPIELQKDIVGFMFPILTKPGIFFTHAYHLEKDIDNLFNDRHTSDLRNFALTCRAVLLRCLPLLLRARTLKCDRERVLIKERPDGTLHPTLRFTNFLALDGPGCGIQYETSDEMDVDDEEEDDDEQQPNEAQLEMERNKPLDPSSVNVTEFERSVANIFKHFSLVGLLHLTDFPLSLMNLWNLKLLKNLHVLSIQSPVECDLIPNVRMIHRVCTLPTIAKLNLIVHGWNEAPPLSNVVKLFEHSIQILSITGINYGLGEFDFISEIFFNPVHRMVFPNLRHVNMDFLEISTKGLRGLLLIAPNLESVVVDCRGMGGFLPLFYAIDMIRIATREPFDLATMLEYDRFIVDPNTRIDHYNNQTMIWDARLSKIYLRFKAIMTPEGPAKVLDAAELFFATADGQFEPVNTEMRFCEMVEVFRSRAFTFRYIRKLVIATDEDNEFVPLEDFDHIKELTSTICRDYLPSAEKVTVKWGETKPICWTRQGIHEMQVDRWMSDDMFYKTAVE